MEEYLHIVFNPTLTANPIADMIESFSKRKNSLDWELSHVVPCTQYEWVAVFSKFTGGYTCRVPGLSDCTQSVKTPVGADKVTFSFD